MRGDFAIGGSPTSPRRPSHRHARLNTARSVVKLALAARRLPTNRPSSSAIKKRPTLWRRISQRNAWLTLRQIHRDGLHSSQRSRRLSDMAGRGPLATESRLQLRDLGAGLTREHTRLARFHHAALFRAVSRRSRAPRNSGVNSQNVGECEARAMSFRHHSQIRCRGALRVRVTEHES